MILWVNGSRNFNTIQQFSFWELTYTTRSASERYLRSFDTSPPNWTSRQPWASRLSSVINMMRHVETLDAWKSYEILFCSSTISNENMSVLAGSTAFLSTSTWSKFHGWGLLKNWCIRNNCQFEAASFASKKCWHVVWGGFHADSGATQFDNLCSSMMHLGKVHK